MRSFMFLFTRVVAVVAAYNAIFLAQISAYVSSDSRSKDASGPAARVSHRKTASPGKEQHFAGSKESLTCATFTVVLVSCKSLYVIDIFT